jgi:hypothetical protein
VGEARCNIALIAFPVACVLAASRVPVDPRPGAGFGLVGIAILALVGLG